jgi:thiol-disulfide isomerase/thioredoxin
MKRFLLAAGITTALAGAAGAALAQSPANDVVAAVRAANAVPDLPRGEKLVAEYRAARGDTPEALEALSWLARGAFAARDLNRAFRYARETQTLVENALQTRPLADDPHLQTALGAAIETRALVQAERGERSDAVYFLTRQLELYEDSAIHKRLERTINLLSLAGQPAPPLVTDEWLGAPGPSLEDLKGRVVLLFFWAHWCPDCKAESPIVARLIEKYRARGLVLVAPTQRFGYVVAGESAAPDVELRHIIEVRDTYYPYLANEAVPLDEANHKRYGVASTPTLALVDREGIVRLYHPGSMTEDELDAAIRGLL